MLRSFPGPALLTCALLFGLSSCSDDVFDSESDLVVLNDSECRISIVVDGREAFVLTPGSDRTLDDIGPGRHVLEATKPDGTVLERRSVELSTGEDFYWFLDSCAPKGDGSHYKTS